MLKLLLTHQELETVKEILKKHIPNYEVWAFGSRVTGKAKKFSDLDLVIITTKKFDIKILFALNESFSDSNLPFKVDIVEWLPLNDFFHENLKSNHIVIQK